MNTSHSVLRISAMKRVLVRLQGFARQYKYFLLAGVLVLAVPVVVTLTFAEEGDNLGEETSLVQDEGEEEVSDNEGGLLGDVGEEEEDVEKDEELEKDEENELGDEKVPEVGDDEEEESSIKDYLTKGFKARYNSPSGKIALRMPNSSGRASRSLTRGVGSGSESYYNSREQSFGYDIRTKDQNSENLCWVYAMTSPIEYYVSKNGLATNSADKEISPKHIDYQNVSASLAYKGSDVMAGKTNLLYDRLISTGHERELGGSADVYNMLVALMNPLGLMSERSFAVAIKANDSRLASITRYEDIWNNGSLVSTVLDAKGAYSEKQNYADMNSKDATNFIVTGADFAFDGTYGESDTKTAFVNKIKDNIKRYGAVSVATFVDADNCMHVDFDKDDNGNPVADGNGVYQVYATVIDRGYNTFSQSYVCSAEMAHQMTIVGWDDTWTYKDNDAQKTGAFILQNSYGDEPYETEDGSGVFAHDNFYMAYNSAFNEILTFSSVEKLSDYDHYYSVEDYEQPVIEAGDNDLVFEFSSQGRELLKTLSFSAIEEIGQGTYDVYVSPDGTVDGFVKDGSLNAYFGVNKYTFVDDIEVNGEYAIKLVAEREMNTFDRAIEVINVFTVDVPEEVTFTLTLDANDGLFPGEATTTMSCTTTETSCEVTIPDTTPARAGKVFSGWADSNEATEKQYDVDSTITLSVNKTIYAFYVDESEPEPEPEPEPPSQSDNANLISLEVQFKVDGVLKYAELDPEFNTEVTEYEVSIPAGYDRNAFEDGWDVLVVGDTEDDNATVYAVSSGIEDGMEIMTITVTAEDGTEKAYELTIYYTDTVPDVPDTGEDEVPSVPNTGFKLKRELGSANRSSGVVIIAMACFIALGVAIRRSQLKTEVNNEAIIFVDKR